jgi:dolichol-phosphate mannosyltransferase
MTKKALVIIPTYNELENIKAIITSVKDAQKGATKYTFEILIVDDNSPDGTGRVVRALARKNKQLHMISGQKAGLGKAYVRGFIYGLRQKRYDAFIMMDADFSHDPEAIPGLLAALEQGNDYVIGSRYVHGGSIPGNWPLVRIINSRFANFLARSLIGIDKTITDLTGGFKAIRSTALEEIDLNSLHAAGYFFQVNLLHAFLQKGFKIAEAPIHFADRTYGDSKLKLQDIIEFIYRAYTLNPQSPIRRLVRFCIVGLSGTVVNLAALSVLVTIFHISAFPADAIAIETSIVSNFFFNYNYTFHSQVKETRLTLLTKLVKFNVSALGGALISFALFTSLYSYAHWQYYTADIIGIIVSTGWNYWISTRLIWKTVDATT